MKLLINKRLEKYKVNSSSITSQDIKSAKKVLFSVFSRYGDGIISFSIIKEFINRFPNKEYIVLTSRQQLPYAKEILSDFNNVIVKKVNKRNPFELLTTVSFLKNINIDLGFNPWGHGTDSEYFITFSKKFYFYKNFDNFEKTYNLYDRIIEYFNLEKVEKKELIPFEINNLNSVLIAPISTDITKNLTMNQVNFLIKIIKNKFPKVEVTVALPSSLKNEQVDAKKFIFGKSVNNSYEYLNILKKSDLFIGVDSGPLHLSLALEIDSIAIFGPTSPLTIFNHNQRVVYLRDDKMKDNFCFVKGCNNPICINEILLSKIFDANSVLDKSSKLEENLCLIRN